MCTASGAAVVRDEIDTACSCSFVYFCFFFWLRRPYGGYYCSRAPRQSCCAPPQNDESGVCGAVQSKLLAVENSTPLELQYVYPKVASFFVAFCMFCFCFVWPVAFLLRGGATYYHFTGGHSNQDPRWSQKPI